MKSYTLSILIGLGIGAIATGYFLRSIGLHAMAGSTFLAGSALFGILLGWSLHAWKGGK